MAEGGLFVLGWDHHQTPVSLRERLAVSGGRLTEALTQIRAVPGLVEVVLLNTCNRTECYVIGEDCICPLELALAAYHGVAHEELRAHAYLHQDAAAARHLFRVVASLESMVLGEYQIVHQVKQAYAAARSAGHTAGGLNPLFQQALALAKQVRNDTGIGAHKVSVASVAVDLALHIHGELSEKRLLICGAGEMAELAVEHLLAKGVRQVSVINRSHDRAAQLAHLHQQADTEITTLSWAALKEALGEHDIIVCSTAAPHAVVTADLLSDALARRRGPVMVIDLAVPRDVEAQAAAIDNVYLYNIDHLDHMVGDNRRLRQAEVTAAEALIERAVQQYGQRSQPQAPALLARLARYFADEVTTEHARLHRRLAAGDELEAATRYALDHLANKFEHRLLRYARTHLDDPEALDLLNELLGWKD